MAAASYNCGSFYKYTGEIGRTWYSIAEADVYQAINFCQTKPVYETNMDSGIFYKIIVAYTFSVLFYKVLCQIFLHNVPVTLQSFS